MNIDYAELDALAGDLMLRRKAHIDREKGSVYYHGRRVAQKVITLRERIFPGEGEQDDALRVAAMFHDVGKAVEPHERYGAAIFREAVRAMLPPEFIDCCSKLILSHCDRRPSEPVHTPSARLLQDADLLDHMGSYNVWMDIQYAAYHDLAPDELIKDFYGAGLEAIVSKHRSLLNYPHSVKIFDDQMAFAYSWVERFKAEMSGGFMI